MTQALRKSGASKGAATGFLISTPQTGIDSIFAAYALLGPVFAVARPAAAFLTGLVSGVAVNAMTAKDEESPAPEPAKRGCCCCHCRQPAAETVAKVKYGEDVSLYSEEELHPSTMPPGFHRRR